MNILIVGTGFSGATCARLLAEKNHNIIIIDKNSFIGGNCYDHLSDDKSCYIHEFGPHIFHTLNEEVWNFVNKFDEFSSYCPSCMSRYENKLYEFPINLNTLERIYNTKISTKEEADKLIHKGKHFNDPKNFEEAAINSVGEKLYKMFMKNYVLKQWKLPAKKISKDIFSRVDIRYNHNNDLHQCKMKGMPIHGYTQLITNIITHKNIKIILNTNFYEFINDKEFDKIIYTGGFGDLPYRSTKFIHFTCEPTDIPVLNLPNDPEYTRIINFNVLHKNFNSKIHNFCLEKPVSNNFCNQLYPIENEDNLNILKKKQDEFLEKYPNTIFCGRLATYKYLDMDKAILQAIESIKNI